MAKNEHDVAAANEAAAALARRTRSEHVLPRPWSTTALATALTDPPTKNSDANARCARGCDAKLTALTPSAPMAAATWSDSAMFSVLGPVVAHGRGDADGRLLPRELHAAEVELELASERREHEDDRSDGEQEAADAPRGLRRQRRAEVLPRASQALVRGGERGRMRSRARRTRTFR